MALTRSAADALGKRLAKSAIPTPEDLQRLAMYRDEFRPIVSQIERVLDEDLGLIRGATFRGIPVTVAQRPAKTFATLIEKLRLTKFVSTIVASDRPLAIEPYT